MIMFDTTVRKKQHDSGVGRIIMKEEDSESRLSDLYLYFIVLFMFCHQCFIKLVQ